MRRALIASILLHVALLGAILVGLPNLGEKLPIEEPISVDIVSDPADAKPSPLPPKAPLAASAPIPQRQAAAPSPPPPPPPAPPEKAPEPKPAPPPAPQVAEAKPAPPAPPPPEKPEPVPEPKKAEAAPEPKPAPPPPPPPEPKKAEAPKPTPPTPPQVKPTPPEPAKPKPETQKPVDLAKLEPKKDTPPRQPTPKQAPSDLDALLASVETQYKRVQTPEKRDAKGVSAERSGTNQAGEAQQAQINPSALVAMISQQVTPCWNIPVGAQGGGLKAELHIMLASDGSVQTVEPIDAARMASDPVFRTFAESAVRAVRSCSPLKLPPESFQVWRNIIFNFDPSALTG